MLVIIKNKTTISGLNTQQKITVARALTIANPDFIQAKQQRRTSVWIAPTLNYYNFVGNDSVEVPIGYTGDLLKLFPLSKEDIYDVRFTAPPIKNIAFKGSLRDYQQKVIDSMSDKTIGVVSAPTGSGKTVQLIYWIVKLKQPTLILVNTLELMNQMVNNIKKFTNMKDVGIVGDSKWSLRPITVATLQTLAKLNKTKYKILNQHFGQIITDECHIIPSFTFLRVLQNLDAKYKFGFSATPVRADGLTDVIFWGTGPLIHEVKLADIKDKLVIPSIRQIKTNYYFPLFSSDEYIAMINDLCEDKERNELILKTVDEYKGKQIVILTQRVGHAVTLTEELRNKGYEAEYLVSRLPNPKKPGKFSAMKKKDRKRIIDNLISGKTRIVCSTYGLFSTGIDIASLEILFIAAPTRSEIKLKQSLGRIFRKASFEKNPVVVDFVDYRIDLLRFQSYARNKIYKYLKET